MKTLLILAMVATLCAACGKKGAPIPPGPANEVKNFQYPPADPDVPQ
jgi:hypothetical protein